MLGHDGGNMGVMVLNSHRRQAMGSSERQGKAAAVEIRVEVVGHPLRADVQHSEKMLYRLFEGRASGDIV
jgi:hypothetical protein